MVYTIFKHAHSGFRWLVLVVLLYSIFNSILKISKKADYGTSDKKINVLTLGLFHTQLLLGLVLYFISPYVQFSGESMSNRVLRFYLVEHLSMMFLAASLLTVGYIHAKKRTVAIQKHRKILIFYSLCLLILFLAIPWPWLNLRDSWF